MSLYLFKKNNFFSVSKATLLFFILVCSLSYICLTPPLRQINKTNEQTQPSRYIPSKPRVEIIGLNYDLKFEGEEKLQLRADRFLIRKKKLGLIRFGLAQEGFFENAEVSFFLKKQMPSLQIASSSSLNDILLPDINYPKRLSSIVMEPVSIIFHGESNKVSRIHANSASIQMQRKEIVLSGDVRMTSGEKHITTSRLIFLPGKNEIYLPDKFLLEIQGYKRTEKPVGSDIFLNSI